VDCQREYEKAYRKKNKALLAARRAERAEQEKAYRQEYDAKHRGRLLIAEARRRCKKRGLAFDLHGHESVIEERVQRGVCEMTGLPFDFHNQGTGWNSPSLDRIDPRKGYIYSNIRVICFGMNAAMGSWGELVLRNMLEAWLKRGI
jgi:hypothetical protein